MSIKVLMTGSSFEGSTQSVEKLPPFLEGSQSVVRSCPVFLLKPLEGPLSASSPLKLTGEEYLIFITPLSVEVFHKSGLCLPSSSRCFAIGAGTSDRFKHYFPTHKIQYPQDVSDQNSEGLLSFSELQVVSGRRIFIFRGDSGREFLAEALRNRGATVEYVTCYERRMNPNFHQFWSDPSPGFIPDIVVLTSTESLRVFLETPRSEAFGTPWITVRPRRMQDLAQEYGYLKIRVLEGCG